MDFLDSKLTEYIESHTDAEAPVLKKLNRETYAKVLMPRMLSGHFQGVVLKMLSHMIRPMQVLEIGTFTGYSAICLADGLQTGGKLHTIDINEELSDIVNKYIEEAGLTEKIKTYTGNALAVIPKINEVFDIVFIDADKAAYPAYYDLVFNKVRTGGYIISDNVLWSGKVVAAPAAMDKDTKIIHDFNEMVQNDPRVENVLLPIRDGLLVARKISD